MPDPHIPSIDTITAALAAMAALGTASFALVDACKTLPGGGPSQIGFRHIEEAIDPLFPKGADFLDILKGNWINGMALADQRAVAKTMIKMRLDEAHLEAFAAATLVKVEPLRAAMLKIEAGEALDTTETNAFGRFDLALTALLDAGYQRADQAYRNGSRTLAIPAAVILALLGGASLAADAGAAYWFSAAMWRAALIGLIATPLAPISKDLTNGLVAAVKALQSVRR